MALILDGVQWEAGRVSQRMRNDPEFMPTPAMMPRIINAEFRLRLLDVNANQTAGRYLTVISSNNAEVSFCSTTCLRNFFNTVVDTFEQSYVSK